MGSPQAKTIELPYAMKALIRRAKETPERAAERAGAVEDLGEEEEVPLECGEAWGSLGRGLLGV